MMLYTSLATLVVIVEAGFIGAVMDLLAEWKGSNGRIGFVGGCLAGLAAVVVGGWLGVVIILVPVAAILSLPSTPEVDPIGTSRRRRIAMWWVKFGMVAIAGLIACSPLVAGMASLRQTGSTAAAIVDAYPTIVSSPNGEQPPARYGMVIKYAFTVGGVTYESTVQKSWVSANGAKVCYQPDDPNGNHSLQKAGYQCGSFDPFGS